MEKEQQVALSCLLSTEAEMILYILESNVLGRNPREVFGNILAGELNFVIHFVRPRKPKPTVRHRGYRDKGSLGPDRVRRRDLNGDVWLKEEQLTIEAERKSIEQTIQFTLGFIQ